MKKKIYHLDNKSLKIINIFSQIVPNQFKILMKYKIIIQII